MKKLWLATLPLILGVSALLQADPGNNPTSPAPLNPAPATTPAETKVIPSPLPTPLSADRYQGRVREAYKAAAEIPDVLAGVTCYCGCDKSMGHRNLLDCFVDDHGAG